MMRECSWRKGCWQWAYGDDRWCYAHLKRREPPEWGGGRDLFASDALEIGRAMRLLFVHRMFLREKR